MLAHDLSGKEWILIEDKVEQVVAGLDNAEQRITALNRPVKQ